MPIYEYRCEPCEQTFETLVRSESDAPRCPDCGSVEVAKQFSVPAAAQVGAGARSAGARLPIASGGCGTPMCCGGGCDAG